MNTSIYKLENIDADLDPFIERVRDAHYVLLGEASHGTSEFYTWRAEITNNYVRADNSHLYLQKSYNV
ncbi:MAG: hypothetical protein M3136_09055 [Thermoproteota archaeon]|nr:hypothetical protein [Thermoproteota archaeon]